MSRHLVNIVHRFRTTYVYTSFVTLAIRCNKGSKESISYHRRLSTGSTNALHINSTRKRSASLARGGQLVLKSDLTLYSARSENIRPRRS